ncbi:MAG: methyltransferase [Planctomycetota bacterium]|nr:methyltransferase [Planctomycetota bacterium]
MSAETTSQSPQDLLVMDLSMGAEDWTPTPHGQCLAEVLAENNLVEGKTVLELGAGTGNHTILLARQGAKHIVATEITQELVETTEVNVKRNVPEASMEYRVADWLATDGSFDVVVTNPPFCKSGKQNRRYYIDSLILDAHKRLNANGTLIFVQSSMADLAKTLERLNENGYEARAIGERRGPFRDYYFEDEQFMKESASVVGGFDVVEGVHYETLSVIAATLRDYTPPAGAHIPDELRA